MNRRNFLALAAAAAAFPSVVLAQQQVVKVGFSYSSPSWSWYDVVSGINNGLMLDLMTAVGKDAGFQVTFSGAILNDLQVLLAARAIDAIATVYVATPERLAVADFSIPVYVYGEALLIRKSDATSYRSVADLRGKTVQPGVFETQLRASGVPMTFVPPTTTVDGMDGVRAGRVNALVYSAPTVAYVLRSGDYPDLATAKDYVPSFLQPVGIAVRKGDTTLLNRINASLTKLIADGTVKAIWAKYGLDWTPPK